MFLCFLAYYVEWHMREALGSLLFDDQELAADRWTRDPVTQADPSDATFTQDTQPTELQARVFELLGL